VSLTSNNHEDDLLSVLISRNPNGMRLENLRRLLEGLSDEEIQRAAEGLVGRGVLEIVEQPNARVPGRVIRTYILTDPSKYPIRETIVVGGLEFPRAFHGDVAGAEDLNAFIEAIAEYDATVKDRVSDLVDDLTRRYWVNMASLLGLFVAVFALIITGTQTVSATTQGSTHDLFWHNVAALGPLAVVLIGFVFLLRLFLRRP
jgi:hypothetical protein